MIRCLCGREHSFIQTPRTRAIQRTTVPEVLQISINPDKPVNMVPGTERLYVYWKISFRIDQASKRIELYVPPEWRTISRDRLEEWVNQLCMYPNEPITLGQTKYDWIMNILVPEGQNTVNIPLPGLNGWPEINEIVPYFTPPRFKPNNGKWLPVGINRIKTSVCLGLEKVVCYWTLVISSSKNNGPKSWAIWVPPEWRKLTPTALEKWSQALANNVGKDIELGGVVYQWKGNTLVPIGQVPNLIERLGFGQYEKFRSDEPIDYKEETATLRERVLIGQTRNRSPSTSDKPPEEEIKRETREREQSNRGRPPKRSAIENKSKDLSSPRPNSPESRLIPSPLHRRKSFLTSLLKNKNSEVTSSSPVPVSRKTKASRSPSPTQQEYDSEENPKKPKIKPSREDPKKKNERGMSQREFLEADREIIKFIKNIQEDTSLDHIPLPDDLVNIETKELLNKSFTSAE